MSKLTEICNAVKIYNDSDFFGDEPYLWLATSDGSRMSSCSCWRITKRGEKLSTVWYYDGGKGFPYFGKEDKKEARKKAEEYMLEKWGIIELARSPFGGWGDATFVKNRIKEIKEMYKNLEE